MVARPADRRSSANAGELSQELAGRVDIKPYYSGGLKFKHIEPVPQSGFRDMGGTVDNGPVRGRMSSLSVTDVIPNPGPHGAGTVTIWSATVAGTVTAVDIASIAADAGAHTVSAQAFAGGAWQTIGAPLPFGTAEKGRTIAAAPGAGIAGATLVRLQAAFGESATVTLGTVTIVTESAVQDIPRYANLRHDSGDRYFVSASTGWLDIYQDDSFAAGIYLPSLTTALVPELGFYTENATIGLFHRTLETIRVRRAGSASEWAVDAWPYEGIPKVDLGGDYTKHDDEWIVYLRWSSEQQLFMTFTVNGESTPSIPLTDADTGDPTSNTNADDDDWTAYAAAIEAALADLPSLNADVTVENGGTAGGRHFNVVFGGSLSGEEYQLDAQVTNTAEIAALATHSEFGKTDFEPLFSANAGWAGGAALMQERLDYFDIAAVQSANLLSRAGEYFDLNIEASGDAAARLDRLRGGQTSGGGQTSERVLAAIDSTYMLVFTDVGVYFVPNRTIEKSKPLNFTVTSENGIVPYTEPIELEKRIFFIARNDDASDNDGHQIMSLSYDELQTSFDARPESLLASHLVRGIMRTKRQKSSADNDASKFWCLRRDGRLVVCQVIKSEDIIGLCEWLAAADGLVREIDIDARNQLRMCVARGGSLRHERRDRERCLQAVIVTTADLSGRVEGLDLHEGREVWAMAAGYGLGPFTVTGGAIELGDYYAGPIDVGLWAAPIYESMPFYRILPNDEMIIRPGRIHTAWIDIIETTSIAVGANGQPAEDVVLLEATDPADAPMPAKSRTLTVAGLLGATIGTTLTITQTRPGRLRVRNYEVGTAL